MAAQANGGRRPAVWASVLAMATAFVVVSHGMSTTGPQAGRVTGKEDVVRIEAAYSPDKDALRIRAHLRSGLAVEYEVEDDTDARRILDMIHVFSGGRARMAVEMSEGSVRTLHVSVP